MKFISKDEAAELMKSILGVDDFSVQIAGAQKSEPVSFEDKPGYSYYSHAIKIVEALGSFDWCLLWVTTSGVWPSNENLYLYYRLRQSYGNHTHLEQQPALVVLKHEKEDLITFVHLGMLFGWDMKLITSHDYGRAFVSHDGFFEVSTVASN